MYCIVYYTAIMVETIPFHSRMAWYYYSSKVYEYCGQQISKLHLHCSCAGMIGWEMLVIFKILEIEDSMMKLKKIKRYLTKSKGCRMNKSASGPQCNKPTRIPRSIFVVKQAIPDTFMDFLQALTLQIPYVRKLIFTHE